MARRVVLDTNVLISALLFGGRVGWLRRAWHDGAVVPLTHRDTIRELLRALGYPKFRLSGGERDELLADLLPWCESVTADLVFSGLPDCPDEGDRKFLALSRAARADALVTGDSHLLDLAGQFEIPIVTPAGLRQRLDSQLL